MYVFSRYGTTANFALAGRSRPRLEELLKRLKVSTKIPLIEATLEDPDSLERMAACCKVVLALAGPYGKVRVWPLHHPDR